MQSSLNPPIPSELHIPSWIINPARIRRFNLNCAAPPYLCALPESGDSAWKMQSGIQLRIFSKKLWYALVRNFFTGKYAVEHGILQLPKGKKHIQQLTIPFTEQLQVRVLSASQDAVVKQVITAYLNVLCIRPGSSIGWATDCLSEGCGFESHPGRYRITGVVWHIQ